MNRERVMKVIAEELGVEFGERFRITNFKNLRDLEFWMDEKGLQCSGNYSLHNYLFIDLAHGYVEIEKLPWEPKLGERYYYPCIESPNAVDWYFFMEEKETYYAIKSRVGVYKTKKAALEKAKELGWVE